MPYARRDSDRPEAAPERTLVLPGGVALATLAGFVNVVSLGVFAVPVSHMTGAVSRLSIDLVTGRSTDVLLVLSIIAGFLAGAIVSGAIIGSGQLRPGRRYGVALLTEASALAGAAALLLTGSRNGVAVAALACGIQNGMASSYYGLIIRTTHVTGIITDLGVLLGQRLRGARIDAWKPTLLVGLLGGFVTGGLLGQLAFARYGPGALIAAAGASAFGGTAYLAWRIRRPDPTGHAPGPTRSPD